MLHFKSYILNTVFFLNQVKEIILGFTLLCIDILMIAMNKYIIK